MKAPIQKLAYCPRHGHRDFELLLAAFDGTICSFNAENGAFLSQWSNRTSKNGNGLAGMHGPGSSSPRHKRRKLSHENDDSETPSAEIVVDGDGTRARRPKQKYAGAPAVVSMLSTTDGGHVVAVTGEDKTLRVFSVSEDGSLDQLNQRAMPKRPSAIALTTDEKTILCADKFGDVYAIPFFVNKTYNDASPSLGNTPADPDVFKPAANARTVHTKRNQEALRQQQLVTKNVAEKKGLDFDHKLLLGHVSLLTDIASVMLKIDAQSRTFILTADRDEHIRVSRGIPQTYVIEGFCQGHEQFISKIKTMPWQPELLISGGGDDYALVWDWLTGTIRQKIDIRAQIEIAKTALTGDAPAEDSQSASHKIALSGIWTPRSATRNFVVFVVECMPMLLIYEAGVEGNLIYRQTILTEGNVLDVTHSASIATIYYSIDTVHKPFSKMQITADPRSYIGSYSLESKGPEVEGIWKDHSSSHEVSGINRWIADEGTPEILPDEAIQLSSQLYVIEHLRKKPFEDQEALD